MTPFKSERLKAFRLNIYEVRSRFTDLQLIKENAVSIGCVSEAL